MLESSVRVQFYLYTSRTIDNEIIRGLSLDTAPNVNNVVKNTLHKLVTNEDIPTTISTSNNDNKYKELLNEKDIEIEGYKKQLAIYKEQLDKARIENEAYKTILSAKPVVSEAPTVKEEVEPTKTDNESDTNSPRLNPVLASAIRSVDI